MRVTAFSRDRLEDGRESGQQRHEAGIDDGKIDQQVGKAARRHAEDRRVAVSGTLGCLILGVERGLWSLEHANGWLERIVAAGFRSPVKNLSALVAKP